MAKKEKDKKNVSIFSLYEKEQIVEFKDNDGRSSSVLFIKMTQGEL